MTSGQVQDLPRALVSSSVNWGEGLTWQGWALGVKQGWGCGGASEGARAGQGLGLYMGPQAFLGRLCVVEGTAGLSGVAQETPEGLGKEGGRAGEV